MNLNKIIWKHRIKHILLDFSAYLIIFVLAILFDKWLEMLMYIVTYSIIRFEFVKMVHGKDFTNSYSKGIVYCRIITFVVQAISLIFLIKINISRYGNMLLALALGLINFFAKDYLEYKVKKTIFFKGMSKEQIPTDLKGIEYNIMYLYYVERQKLEYIAQKVGYCLSNVKTKKREILKRYSK